MNIRGKAALITGGSRGIGRAIARTFGRNGARVAVHYHRDKHAAESAAGELDGSGHIIVQADISRHDEVRALVGTTIAALGGLDILVNNAGVFEIHPPATVSYDEWLAAWAYTIGVNLMGAACASYLAVQHMLGTGGGRIINISSRGAFRGEPDAPAYGASKAAMNAMGQSMAKALAPHNILVFTMAPGWVETDMAIPHLAGPGGDEIRGQSPFQRVASPEEIADTALFLASSAPAYMTGCIIDINGASYLRT